MKCIARLHNIHEHFSEYRATWNFLLSSLSFKFLINYIAFMSTDDVSMNIILRLRSSYKKQEYNKPESIILL
jgi:hypothetical protein